VNPRKNLTPSLCQSDTPEKHHRVVGKGAKASDIERSTIPIEPRDAKIHSEARNDFVGRGTRVDQAQPAPKSVGKRIGGVRLTEEDMDFL
jgi:hypothetical protein